jgi:uncharacterized protein YyaL (SSP411 family)
MHVLAFVLALTVFATPNANATATSEERALHDRALKAVAASFDTERKAFVTKQGVPSEDATELSFALASGPGGDEWRSRALATVVWTRSLMDTVGGGFVEGTADADIGSTVFEKKTGSNARRLANLVRAWMLTGDPMFLSDTRRSVDYFDRVLIDGRGGFISAQVGDRELEPEPNAYAIRAWLECAVATTAPHPRDFALKSLDRVWETCAEPNLGLLRRGTFGEPLKYPQLIDQVEMGRTLLYAYQVAGRPQDLQRARALAQVMTRIFADTEKGGFRTQAAAKKDGTIKKAARVPEENARAARFLIELGEETHDPAYFEAARGIWTVFAEDIDKAIGKEGPDATDWALSLHAFVAPEHPTPPAWQAVAVEQPTPRRKSFSIKRSR